MIKIVIVILISLLGISLASLSVYCFIEQYEKCFIGDTLTIMIVGIVLCFSAAILVFISFKTPKSPARFLWSLKMW